MNTQEINDIFRRLTPDQFLGTFPLNHLPNLPPLRHRGVGFVVNTDDCQKPGEHWVAVYLYRQQGGDWFGEYFDSLGYYPPPSIVQWLKRTCSTRWIHNSVPLQHPLSVVCGCYCVYYLYQRLLSENNFHHIIQFLYRMKERDTFVYNVCRQLSKKHRNL